MENTENMEGQGVTNPTNNMQRGDETVNPNNSEIADSTYTPPINAEQQGEEAVRTPVDRSASSPLQLSVDLSRLREPESSCTAMLGGLHYPLLHSIENTLRSLPTLPHDCCIYCVPTRLRATNGNAYTPQIVSIGPLHHGSERLQAMEGLKWTYLQNFLCRTNVSLAYCIDQIEKWEPEVRKCYAKHIELGHDDFAGMILLDGVFIIETLLNYASPILDNDSTYYTAHVITDVRPDMILLENQLPFFVLEGLFDLGVASQNDQMPSLLKLSLSYFADIKIMDGDISLSETIPTLEVKHFVDLLRICHIKSMVRSFPLDGIKYVRTHNITELDEAGVKLEKSPSNSLLDIRFALGKLEIPHLVIQDITETVLRNIVAFELCHYGICSYIIDYVYFMDNLIDTVKDVDLLVKNDIMHNLLGDNAAVATLFNRITKEATMRGSNFYYYSISQELNAFCRVPWHTWKATLKRDYFSTPWRIASTIAAVVLLMLTAIQTICSIKSA